MSILPTYNPAIASHIAKRLDFVRWSGHIITRRAPPEIAVELARLGLATDAGPVAARAPEPVHRLVLTRLGRDVRQHYI